MNKDEQELIELVKQTFNESISEEYGPLDAANHTIFEIAKTLANNPNNQLIVYKQLMLLLNQEKNSDLYRRLESFVNVLNGET